MPQPPPMQPNPPRWLGWAFPLAAALACAGALAVVWSGWQRLPDHHRGMIADRVFQFDGRPVREHCTTCHPQGRAAGGSAHPDIAPHRSDRLGCTACHLGEGMALDRTISHGLPGSGAQQVLKGREVEGRCFACHELQPLAGAERAWEGALLFQSRACSLCHRLGELGGGGFFGPDLGAIGSQLGLERINAAIREPGKDFPDAVMPRFPLSPAQVDKLTLFLKSRVASPSSHRLPRESRPREAVASASPSAAPSPLERFKCLACHRFGDSDGRVAPDLSFIGDQRSAAYLNDFLIDPGAIIPGAIMPLPALSVAERADLVARFTVQARGPLAMNQARPLYMHLCQRCHAANGDGRGLIQTNLAGFPRPFAGNAEFFRRVGDKRLRQSLADGVPGTSMPPFGQLLPERQRDELIDLVFAAFIGIPRTEKATLPPLPPSTVPSPAVAAEALFLRRCARCHGPAGNGWGPDSPGLLPRPRDFTNRLFMAMVEDERLLRAIVDGVPGTAMPGFRLQLNPEEATSLVARVRDFPRSGDD